MQKRQSPASRMQVEICVRFGFCGVGNDVIMLEADENERSQVVY
jgi:hypothetical protein